MVKLHWLLSGCAMTLVTTVSAQDIDPTRPFNYTPSTDAPISRASTEVRVQSIWYREPDNRSLAVINGELRYQGEQVNEFRITAIEPDRVRLQSANQQIWIYVYQPQGLLSRPSVTHQEKP